MKNEELVLVIACFEGQLRINFLIKILKFFCKGRAIAESFKILQGKLIHHCNTNYAITS